MQEGRIFDPISHLVLWSPETRPYKDGIEHFFHGLARSPVRRLIWRDGIRAKLGKTVGVRDAATGHGQLFFYYSIIKFNARLGR